MRRVCATLTTLGLLLALGCGKSYEERLEKTLERMRYEKRLNDNLMPAPTKEEGKFHELAIYLRPPKSFKLSKEFAFPLDPGKFDLEATFLDEKDTNQALHVLARVKRAKAPAKKGAPAPAETAARGEFNADVVAILNSVYSTDLDVTKFKEENKKGNKFKHPPPFEANGKNVQVYLYGSKTDQHEVALIFEYPKAEQASLVSKIELCLESFAVGRKAQASYAGTLGEEESGEGGAGGGPGVVF